MPTITKDELSELCSYEVSRELRLKIISESEAEGVPVAVIADRYAMPPLVFPDANGYFKLNGELFNKESFKARWPYRRIVTIT